MMLGWIDKSGPYIWQQSSFSSITCGIWQSRMSKITVIPHEPRKELKEGNQILGNTSHQ